MSVSNSSTIFSPRTKKSNLENFLTEMFRYFKLCTNKFCSLRKLYLHIFSFPVFCLNNKVDTLIAETNTKMHDLIEKYNEDNEDNESVPYVDTVDLNAKFDDLADYIEDYS